MSRKGLRRWAQVDQIEGGKQLGLRKKAAEKCREIIQIQVSWENQERSKSSEDKSCDPVWESAQVGRGHPRGSGSRVKAVSVGRGEWLEGMNK